MGNAIEKIGKEVARFEEFLNQTYRGGWEINTFGFIGDLTVKEGGETANPITFHFSDPRRWVQEALLEEAAKLMLQTRENEEPEELGPGEEEDIDAA